MPGTGEDWYEVNINSIYRGVEGQWFRASDDFYSSDAAKRRLRQQPASRVGSTNLQSLSRALTTLRASPRVRNTPLPSKWSSGEFHSRSVMEGNATYRAAIGGDSAISVSFDRSRLLGCCKREYLFPNSQTIAPARSTYPCRLSMQLSPTRARSRPQR